MHKYSFVSLVAVSFVFLGIFLSSQAQAEETALTGTLNGKIPIEMKLNIDGQDAKGSYLYTKYKTDIPLKGTADAGGNLVLSEFDDKGNMTGTFKGKLSAGGKFEGQWSKPDGSKVFPFALESKAGGTGGGGAAVGTGELTQGGVFENAAQEDAFAKSIGSEPYNSFLETFQLINEQDDLDGLGARVRSGFVRGLAMEMAGIIMCLPSGKYCAAKTDGDRIKVFSNDERYIKTLPKTIAKWREPFTHISNVVFVSTVSGKTTAPAAGSAWVKGKWNRVGTGRFDPSSLEISAVASTSFSFLISAASGANVGEMAGEAKFQGDKAVFTDKATGCVATFTKKGAAVIIEAPGGCDTFGGVGVTFGGEYK